MRNFSVSLLIFFFETGSSYVTQTDLELLAVLLVQPLNYWDYRMYHHVWLP